MRRYLPCLAPASASSSGLLGETAGDILLRDSLQVLQDIRQAVAVVVVVKDLVQVLVLAEAHILARKKIYSTRAGSCSSCRYRRRRPSRGRPCRRRRRTNGTTCARSG